MKKQNIYRKMDIILKLHCRSIVFSTHEFPCGLFVDKCLVSILQSMERRDWNVKKKKNFKLSESVNDLHVLKTYFPHLETSVVTCHLQAVTLNLPLISIAFTSLLNGLDKWVWGAPYATKWSVPRISMAIMSWGLRAGWCPVCSSVASKQLHYVSEPPRIVLYVFCCLALWIQGDLSPEIHGGWLSMQNHTVIQICKGIWSC